MAEAYKALVIFLQLEHFDSKTRLKLLHEMTKSKFGCSFAAQLCLDQSRTWTLEEKLELEAQTRGELRKISKKTVEIDVKNAGKYFPQFSAGILIEIFKYLNLKSVCRVAKVCKLWRIAAMDMNVWKMIKLRYSKHDVKLPVEPDLSSLKLIHDYFEEKKSETLYVVRGKRKEKKETKVLQKRVADWVVTSILILVTSIILWRLMNIQE